jgi:uncharacterized protein YcbK (DUF882 family)
MPPPRDWAAASTAHFSRSELFIDADPHYGYGVFAGSILNGLEAVRAVWLDSTTYTSLSVNSVYRSPRRTKDINSTAKQSRHMYGDAADLRNPAKDMPNAQEIWLKLFNLARTFSGGRVLDGTQDSKCSLVCVHMDYKPQ